MKSIEATIVRMMEQQQVVMRATESNSPTPAELMLRSYVTELFDVLRESYYALRALGSGYDSLRARVSDTPDEIVTNRPITQHYAHPIATCMWTDQEVSYHVQAEHRREGKMFQRSHMITKDTRMTEADVKKVLANIHQHVLEDLAREIEQSVTKSTGALSDYGI